MDRKSLIGFFMMMLLAGGYFWYSNSESDKYQEQKRYEDSVAAVLNPKIQDTLASTLPTLSNDTIEESDSLAPAAMKKGSGKLTTLTNGLLTVQFNTKGAVPEVIQLDSFKTYDQKELYVANGVNNKFNITLPLDGSTIQTQDLIFQETLTQGDDGAAKLEMKADLGGDKAIIYTYILPKGSYMLQAQLRIVGMQADLNGATSLPLDWTTEALTTEKDIAIERKSAQIHYLFTDTEHDYFTIKMTQSQKVEKPMKWMSMKTHFFNSTIIADDKFLNGSFDGVIDDADSNKIFTLNNKLSIPIQASNDITFGYRWMMGPNDYHLLKSYDLSFEEMIPLGFGIFFFVKYISKWLVIPLFTFLNGSIANMGLVIILVTLIIRIFLSFFSYKSHLSSAKMKALKPEIEALKEKHAGDQQAVGMEQMKLYRAAGVNPLGGCIPMLLQMPFLLAMYYFFPTAIELRQAKFLWAEDLSTYDSIATWTTNIPLISSVYGNHLSLFTLFMAVTSILLALYSRNMQPSTGGNDMNMKMMRVMPFIMPIMFLGWFNSFAAGLTFYYTFSNLLSLLQQWIFQKFVINEDAILAKIQDKKKVPKKTSKWQQKLEDMQKVQQDRIKQPPNKK